MRRATPRIRVEDLDKGQSTALSSAESAPSASDCVSLSQDGMTVSGGFASPLNAIMPDKHLYERVRFLVEPTVTGGPTTATFTLWERTPDGEVVQAAEEDLTAAGSIPNFEIDNHDARYSITLSVLSGGSSPTVKFKVWVQGVYSPEYVATNG